MLCDKLEGWNGVGDGGRFKREGEHACSWQIHGDMWQKPAL